MRITVLDEGVTEKINKAKGALADFSPDLKAQEDQARLLESNVKSALFYRLETWKVTTQLTHRLQTFVKQYLRTFLRI